MHDQFLSLVILLHDPTDHRRLPTLLPRLLEVVSTSFTHFEFVLVNNLPELPPDEYLTGLPAELRAHLYLINLSRRTLRNHAILAGLDRANGDYTLLFETIFLDHPGVVTQLFAATRNGADIAYLRAPRRLTKRRGLHGVFIAIMRRYSTIELDSLAHDTRIISRRALNSLLRLRENLRYMKAVYSLVGYRSVPVATTVPLQGGESFPEQFRTSLLAVTSYTTFLRSLLAWIFGFSLLFLLGVVLNAVLVRFSGFDLFGIPQEALSGWTFLVVFIAIFFAVMCLNLYIISIYLSNIYDEIKQRPPYIVSGVQRF